MYSSPLSLSVIVSRLHDIGYTDVKDILSQIVGLKLDDNQRMFWELFDILYNPQSLPDKFVNHDNDDQQNQPERPVTEIQQDYFAAWLETATKAIIPIQCDNFIRALFTHDRDTANKLGQEFFPYIPLLTATKFNKLPEQVPESFINKTFQFGPIQLKGEDVWNMLICRFECMLKYNISWIFIFALQYWYCSQTGDIVTCFKSFSLITDKNLEQEEKNDPNYQLLLKFAVNHMDLIEIAAVLPPLDAHIFMHLTSVLFNEKISPDLTRHIADYAAAELIAHNQWEYAASVYKTHNYRMEADFVIAKYCDPTIQMNDNEKRLIEELGISEDILLLNKSRKAAYVAFLYSSKTKLQKLATAIDLFFLAHDANTAAQLIFTEYIPLAAQLGENLQDAAQWLNHLNSNQVEPKYSTDIRVLETINGNSRFVSDTCSALEQGYSTYVVRREICNILLKNKANARLLRNVDAAPKLELLSLQ